MYMYVYLCVFIHRAPDTRRCRTCNRGHRLSRQDVPLSIFGPSGDGWACRSCEQLDPLNVFDMTAAAGRDSLR